MPPAGISQPALARVDVHRTGHAGRTRRQPQFEGCVMEPMTVWQDWRRIAVVAAALLVLSLLGVGPVAAHGEQSDEAAVLVRQAIVLIVSSPDDLGED